MIGYTVKICKKTVCRYAAMYCVASGKQCTIVKRHITINEVPSDDISEVIVKFDTPITSGLPGWCAGNKMECTFKLKDLEIDESQHDDICFYNGMAH